MGVFTLILLVLTAALWFFIYEFDGVFGVYYPTCAVRRHVFSVVVLIALIAGICLSRISGMSGLVLQSFSYQSLNMESVILILLASLISLRVLRLSSVTGSIALAMTGAIMAYSLTISKEVCDIHFILSFIVAPVLAFILSYLLMSGLRAIFTRVKPHLILLSYYMRFAVIAGIVLSAGAVGLNWGGYVIGVSEMVEGVSLTLVMTVVLIASFVSMLLQISNNMQSEVTEGMFKDFSIYAVISVGLSVALTLIFFSFEKTTSIIGLYPAPLSVMSLVISSVAAAGLAQKSSLLNVEEFGKEVLSYVLTPIGAFLIAYVLFSIISRDGLDMMLDFIVMTTAFIILIALSFVGYVRIQRHQHEVKDKLVYTQQQQIYEHSRALSDMELKVVLSENQALHNAVAMKKQEVMNVALSIVEQREFLESLSETVKKLEKAEEPKERDGLIAELKMAIKQRLSYEGDVDSQYFYAQAESLHEDFNAKLSENFPNLTQQERRLATLLRLGFSSKYIATLMNITPKSVEISRYRLRQKLGMDKGDNLVNFIKSI